MTVVVGGIDCAGDRYLQSIVLALQFGGGHLHARIQRRIEHVAPIAESCIAHATDMNSAVYIYIYSPVSVGPSVCHTPALCRNG